MQTRTRIILTAFLVLGVIGGAYAIGRGNDLAVRDGAFVIDRFDQHVTIDADGVTQVTEDLRVSFSTERRGIFRDLDVHTSFPSIGGYSDFEVDRGDPTEPWTFAIEGGPTGPRIRIGDRDVFLDPGTYDYSIGYRAPSWYYRLEDTPETVEVRIDTPGFDWPTSVGPSSLTLELPGRARQADCVEGARGTTRACTTPPVLDGQRVDFTFGPFDDHESATVAVRLDAAAFTEVDRLPVHDAQPLDAGGGIGPWPLDRGPAAVLLALLLAAPILGWELLSARVVYRDRMTDPALHDRLHPTAIPAPPFGYRPPEVAGLLLRTDGNDLFLSALVDLDQRGGLATSVSTTPGRFLSADTEALTVTPGAEVGSLPPGDAQIVHALVPNGSSTTFDGEYDKEVAARTTKAQAVLTGRAKSVFEANGFRHEQGGLVGATWFRGVVTAGYLGIAALTVWLVTASTPLHPVAGGIVAALVLIGWGALMAMWRHHRLPLNSEGRDAVAQARSFEEFVRTVEGEQLEWAAGQPGISHLHPAVSLLPYAIALGLADSWYERFGSVLQELTATEGPDEAGSGSAAAATAWWASQSSFGNVSSSQSGTTTAPSSSGGSSGGGSGGGGGGGGSW